MNIPFHDGREEAAMKFTAEDYRKDAELIVRGWPGEVSDQVLISALRIAARVLEPGVIEEAIGSIVPDPAFRFSEAATIRHALTDQPGEPG